MKNSFLFLMSAGVLMANIASAQEINPTKPYRATTKSSFALPKGERNPFWPVGYVARSKNVSADDELLRIPVEQFKVSAIILDVPSIAVINGKDYTRGQFLIIKTATGSTQLLISNIEDGSVTVQYKDKVAKIPISRK